MSRGSRCAFDERSRAIIICAQRRDTDHDAVVVVMRGYARHAAYAAVLFSPLMFTTFNADTTRFAATPYAAAYAVFAAARHVYAVTFYYADASTTLRRQAAS